METTGKTKTWRSINQARISFKTRSSSFGIFRGNNWELLHKQKGWFTFRGNRDSQSEPSRKKYNSTFGDFGWQCTWIETHRQPNWNKRRKSSDFRLLVNRSWPEVQSCQVLRYFEKILAKQQHKETEIFWKFPEKKNPRKEKKYLVSVRKNYWSWEKDLLI